MKIAISYPPLEDDRTPTLGQNRQFQWFHNPSFIYPMVPASAATLLKSQGHDVLWNDAIAMSWTPARFKEFLLKERPEVLLIETKTPVVKRHWELIRDIKEYLPATIVVICGDHVTALPEETLKNCPVDFVITGGDYDFMLSNLVSHLDEGTPLEEGFWFVENGTPTSTGEFALRHDLDSLPEIDRDLTRWDLYGEHLFIKSPHTYTMAGRDCWYARCAFCSWTTLYPKFRARSAELVLEEIEHLSTRYGVKEIFDDTGTFPVAGWLDRFCSGMIESGLAGKVTTSCNMRVGALSADEYALMKQAGFRLLKFGLESANQETLDRLDKGTTVAKIVESCRLAKRAGLTVHLTTMVGYPWESKAQAQATLDLARDLLRSGDADMLQATIVIPYPGTPLFRMAEENDWLLTRDWDMFDMRGPVMRTPIPDDELRGLTRGLYSAFLSPRFAWRTLKGIRSVDDLRFVTKAGRAVLGHLRDFRIGKRS